MSSSSHHKWDLSGYPQKLGAIVERPGCCAPISAFVSEAATRLAANEGPDPSQRPLIANRFSSGVVGSPSYLKRTRWPSMYQSHQSCSGWLSWLADVLWWMWKDFRTAILISNSVGFLVLGTFANTNPWTLTRGIWSDWSLSWPALGGHIREVKDQVGLAI